MDIRLQLMQDVILDLSGKLDVETISVVQESVILALQNYEIQERCTDVAIYDNSNDGMLKRYLASKSVEGLAESTLERYAYENMNMLHAIGKSVTEITAYDIRYYLAVLKKERNLQNSTLNGMKKCYSGFFGWLYDEGVIAKNPCKSIPKIKCRKVVRKPFSQVEIEMLRNACQNKRDIALLDFLYSTGCRVSEVSALDIDNVDFEKKEVLVLGKGNKERTVYFSDVCGMELQEYLKSRNDDCEALFVGNRKSRMKKTGIEATLKRIGNRAGVENVHPHRYRRTLATGLSDRGMALQDVARILGHADLGTTQVYCCINQENVKNAYKKYL